jgi:hypothetical protein
MKVLNRLYVLVIALVITIIPVSTVNAAEKAGNAGDAKQGVVQVNTTFLDDNGQKHVICGGAGFLIGDAEGTEYVITCNHIVSPSQEVKDAAYDYLQISNENDNWSKINLSTEVVVEGDVVLTTSLLTASSELDMAVLQLPQPIYTKEPLTILTEANYDITKLPYQSGDTVFALGFPEAITYDSQVQYYMDNQIASNTGSIVSLLNRNGIQVVETNAVINSTNYGGPLVDSNGYVIGMNMVGNDGETGFALDSTKIIKVLDGLGVVYSQVNDVPHVDKKPETDETQPAAAPVPEQKSNSVTTLIIICVAAVVIIAAVITLVVLLVLRKDKKAKTKDTVIKSYNGPAVDFNVSNVSEKASDETTILGGSFTPANDGETQLLSGELKTKQNFGTLVRKRTSERIEINKQDFSIGKDALHSDFFIENNSSISRKHAVISGNVNGVFIQDCNSTNGTFVNGTKLESGGMIRLNDGDSIKMSNEEFEYQA